MKTMKLVLALFVASLTLQTNAQTAEEIVDTYLENIGGKENLAKIQSLKMIGKINAQGMEIPFETATTSKGEVYMMIDLQGTKMKQLVANGEKAWNMNMMTRKMEQMPQEMADALITEFKDFPNPFMNYKEKGYTIELLGEDTQEGTECFKLKLTKKPLTFEGEQVPNIAIYYFDKENFVPIALETEVPTGPAKGQVMKTPLSDYQEVNGVYFPFSTSMQGMPLTYTTIEMNPTFEKDAFEVPEEVTPATDGNKN